MRHTARAIFTLWKILADPQDAFDWYEKQRSGLGAEFREAVREKLRDIAAGPML